MYTFSSHEKAVCLSACPSVRLSVKRVDCNETKETYAHILIPHERSFIYPNFITRRMVGGGRPLLPEILGQTDRVGAKTPIFNLFSLVAPQP